MLGCQVPVKKVKIKFAKSKKNEKWYLEMVAFDGTCQLSNGQMGILDLAKTLLEVLRKNLASHLHHKTASKCFVQSCCGPTHDQTCPKRPKIRPSGLCNFFSQKSDINTSNLLRHLRLYRPNLC